MPLPSWAHWYKKPSYIDIKVYGAKLNSYAERSSPRSSFSSTRPKTDVPKKLSLERILENRTCSPMSLYDFYMYLKYIEHSSENLEFYAWFKNYEKGLLTAQATPSLKSTPSDSGSQTSLKGTNVDDDDKTPDIDIEAISTNDLEAGIDVELYARIAGFVQPSPRSCGNTKCAIAPLSAAKQKRHSLHSSMIPKVLSSKSKITTSPTDFHSAQVAELAIIKKLFLSPNSPKELNIPAPMRQAVLTAMETNTDPVHLKPVAEHCYLLLKNCSHRNFIRLSVSNGTFETLCVATSMGIVLTFLGFLYLFLFPFVHFRHQSRWKGIGAWPLLSLGIGLLLAGLRGTCFFLLLFLRRQPLPWERYEDDKRGDVQRKGLLAWMSKMMIFDRKMKVKDNALRALQRKIVVQSLAGGIGTATIVIVVFLCLPIWRPL